MKSKSSSLPTSPLSSITPSLFEQSMDAMAKEKSLSVEPIRPLADRMRPRTLAEFVGQQNVVASGTLLHRLISEDQLHSLILWGPPGTGKTTLAQIIAHHTKALFMPFSAVVAGIKEVRIVMADAERYQQATGRRTVLFIDEIHRFNRAQQDAFLPYVENGTIILIGATTENPSFEVNAALLSRAKVIVLEPLRMEEILTILKHALSDQERGLMGVKADEQTLEFIANYASGDARTALNTLELAALSQSTNEQGERLLSSETIKTVMQRAVLRYDKSGEEHFNLISAFIKSIRNSDVDAALYWLARMLEAGEDARYVARRLVHHASEDIGLADPFALNQAVAAMQAVEFIGLPEAKLALAQATIYLARAPKSNAVLTAYMAAAKDALETEREAVPLHLRNAATSIMKQLGYGSGYQYAHDLPTSRAEMDCLPANLHGHKYYQEKKTPEENPAQDTFSID